MRGEDCSFVLQLLLFVWLLFINSLPLLSHWEAARRCSKSIHPGLQEPVFNPSCDENDGDDKDDDDDDADIRWSDQV